MKKKENKSCVRLIRNGLLTGIQREASASNFSSENHHDKVLSL